MNRYLLAILLFDGVIWAKSSFGKFTSGNFVQNLGVILDKFASGNPYPWFKSFLQNIAVPSSQLFGNMVLYGELLVAIAIIITTLSLLINPKGCCGIVKPLLILGLFGGALMNLFFWLASGWTSPSTDGLNLLMFVTQLAGLLYILRFQKV